ncbi:MAG TPA: T9SS type A sorting domain-containing protein [Bacteroidetes bacterium]|nr:hypothetical protein BMS3Bbin04_01280 [bacterium BMS3Bbin04]HDO65240.1 T9SS type A sorting domain-containing protein [Bacteroidota bacterium]HEX04365.1 T9SS type A sorting domain-containing protein [Bacteroidota bacterium]
MKLRDFLTALVILAIPLTFQLQAVAQPPDSEGPDFLASVVSDGDGIYVAGHTSPPGSHLIDAIIARLDDDGTPLWTATIDNGFWDQFDDLAILPGGDIVAVGASGTNEAGNYNALLARYTADGDLLWSQQIETAAWDAATGVKVDPNGGLWISGHSAATGSQDQDMLLIRADADGDTLYTRIFEHGNHDFALDIALTQDGGAVLAGFLVDNGDYDRDVVLIRVDSEGDSVWERIVELPLPNDAHSIVSLDDGGFAVAGLTHLHNEDGEDESDALLMRFDGEGNLLWWEAYGGAGFDEAWDLSVTPSGGYIVAGFSESDDNPYPQAWTFTTDGSGTLLSTSMQGGPGTDQARGIAALGGNEYALVGFTMPGDGADNNFLFTRVLDTGVQSGEPYLYPTEFLLQAFPNPFNSFLSVKVQLPRYSRMQVSVFNILGQRICTLADANLPAKTHTFAFDADRLSSGIYIIQARAGDGSMEQTMRVTLLR